MAFEIGGADIVTLQPPEGTGSREPRFISATLLPGRGMNVFQIRANVPGLGAIGLLRSPSLEEARVLLESDPTGVLSFSLGAAILLPFANRIRGKLLAGDASVETAVGTRVVRLPANWQGKVSGAEKCAIHGLILKSQFELQSLTSRAVKAVLNAGNFGGHWLSL